MAVAVAVPAGLTGVLTLGNTSVLWGLSPPHTRGGTPVRFPNTCLLGDASPVPERPGPPARSFPFHGRISRKKTRGCLEEEAPWGAVARQGLGFSPCSLWTQLLDTTPAPTRKALYAAGPNQM